MQPDDSLTAITYCPVGVVRSPFTRLEGMTLQSGRLELALDALIMGYRLREAEVERAIGTASIRTAQRSCER